MVDSSREYPKKEFVFKRYLFSIFSKEPHPLKNTLYYSCCPTGASAVLNLFFIGIFEKPWQVFIIFLDLFKIVKLVSFHV